MSFQTVKSGYKKTRDRHSGNTPQEQDAYDFDRLVDATWGLKVAIELFSAKKLRLGKMMKHDLFNLVIVCSRQIDEGVEVRKKSACFLDCWISFREIIEIMSANGEELDDELVLSLARILFMTALIFCMPDRQKIENIIANPTARRLPGTFPASAGDINFSKTLPCDLNGLFESSSEILTNLDKNLRFYCNEIKR